MKFRNIFLFVLYLLSCSFLQGQIKGLTNENLVDYKGEVLKNDILNKGVSVFFIISYTCGPCLQSMDKYNKLVKQFSKINFVAIIDNDSSYVENYYKRTGKKCEMPQVYDRDLVLSEKYWKRQVWPEFHVYKNGKLKKRLIDASEKTYNKLIYTLQSL